MYKLKMVIADYDGQYLNKVLDYLSSFYLSRFQVSAFTQPVVFQDYMRCCCEKINILLAHPDFLNFKADLYDNVEMILILSDGSIECCSHSYRLVNKFIPGEKMVSELVRLYAEKNSQVSQLIKGSRQSKLVPVYSAAGGSGKSTITLGLASKLGRMGKKTLILSLECLNSILPGLRGTEDFAHIIFTAIDDPGSLPVKAETHISSDPANDFDYIEPPGCFCEISQLQGREAGLLLEGLVQLGKYDIILVDMDSKPDDLALEVLGRADKIVLIVAGDLHCDRKTNQFLKQIGRQESFSCGLTDKILPVLNKYDGGSKGFLETYGLDCPFTVPVFPNLWHRDPEVYRFDVGQNFSNSLIGIVNAITERSDFGGVEK